MNHNNQWGIVIGKPTKVLNWEGAVQALRDQLVPIVGSWLPGGLDGNQPYPALYNTREEARKAAKKFAKANKYWNYHAKKYS